MKKQMTSIKVVIISELFLLAAKILENQLLPCNPTLHIKVIAI